MHHDQVGPGIVNFTGDQEIDRVVFNTTVTVTDCEEEKGLRLHHP